MTVTFHADGAQSTVVRFATALIFPIAAWAAVGLWQGYPAMVVLGVAIPVGALSWWAVRARGTWQQIVVGTDSLTLKRQGTPDVLIERDSVLKLELRETDVVIKWRALPKDQVELLAKERFSASTWDSLSEALKPWVK